MKSASSNVWLTAIFMCILIASSYGSYASDGTDMGDWTWLNRTPTGDAVTDIWSVNGNEYFVTTEHNEILHYTDGVCKIYTLENVFLESIWGSSPTDVWAAGSEGKVFRFDGTEWTLMTTEAAGDLRAIHGFSGSDVYAAGSAGEVAHWDGSAWTVTGLTGSPDLYCIWGLTTDQVFAGGAFGEIFMFDGSSWKQQTVPVSDFIGGFCGFASDAVYAAGSEGNILKYDGSEWSVENSGGSVGFVDICALAEDNIYVSGVQDWQRPACIYHFDGVTWEWININFGKELFINRCVCPLDADTLLAGCWTSELLTIEGTTGYTHFSGPRFTLNAVWGDSADNLVFACGMDPTLTGYAYRWNGSALEDMGLPATAGVQHGVWSPGNGTYYFVGQDCWEYSDQTFSPIPELGDHTMYDVFGFDATSIFACGRRGTVMFYDGTTWSELEKPSAAFENPLNSLWGPSPDAVYIAGDGCILFWDGNVMKVMHEPQEEILDIWGRSTDDVYAVGTNDTILHWDGNTWSSMASGYDLQHYFIKEFGTRLMISSYDYWGHETYILIWNGTGWDRINGNQLWILRELWSEDNDKIYCCGHEASLRLWDLPGDPPPTPTPTATPTIPPLGVDLVMSKGTFYPGDHFQLAAVCSNPGTETYPEVPLAVLLEVVGLYYWHPLWTEEFQTEYIDLSVGSMEIPILEFTWPENAGSFEPAYFYGAMLTPEMSEILGTWDMETFGWTE